MVGRAFALYVLWRAVAGRPLRGRLRNRYEAIVIEVTIDGRDVTREVMGMLARG